MSQALRGTWAKFRKVWGRIRKRRRRGHKTPDLADAQRRLRKKIANLEAQAPNAEWNGRQPVPQLAPVVAFANKRGMYVVSTVRSVSHNAAVGGSPTSYHLPPPRAVDLAGGNMAAVQTSMAAEFGDSYFTELFGPAGFYIKNGRRYQGHFPGHADHIHAVKL